LSFGRMKRLPAAASRHLLNDVAGICVAQQCASAREIAPSSAIALCF
jgi:hypothetical protein